MRINRSFLSCLISHFQSEAMFKTVDVVGNFTDSRLGVYPLWKKEVWGRLLWNVPMTWTLDTDKSQHFPGWGRFVTSLFCGRPLMLKQKPVGMSSTILLWLSASMHMGKYKHTFNICPTYGTYTRMLCRVLNTCWGDQGTNVELYGDLQLCQPRSGSEGLTLLAIVAVTANCQRASLSCGGQHTDIYVLAVSITKTAEYVFKSHSRPAPPYPPPRLTITEFLIYVMFFYVHC